MFKGSLLIIIIVYSTPKPYSDYYKAPYIALEFTGCFKVQGFLAVQFPVVEPRMSRAHTSGSTCEPEACPGPSNFRPLIEI